MAGALTFSVLLRASVVAGVAGLAAIAARAQAPGPAAPVVLAEAGTPSAAAAQAVNDPWPREIATAGASVLVYQPQVVSWDGRRLEFRVAMSLKPVGGTPTFGVVSGSASTSVDRLARLVDLDDFGVLEIRFPTLPDNGAAYMPQLRQAVRDALATISLNRVAASLAASRTVRPTALAVNNAPPNVVVAYGPALLVPIDGAPVVKPAADTRFERVVNTQALIARKRFDSTWYLHVYDGWLSSSSLDGPWTRPWRTPLGLDDLATRLAKAGSVDLLTGGGATPKPSLDAGVPAIYVTQVPTELIAFKGTPNFVPVAGTALLWASNTAADVFVNTANNAYYLLISGRWFTAPGLTGPWSFVPASALPADFARIPPGTPPATVLAAVAGTPQAQEAVIENSIPQTAAISLANPPVFTPSFDGAPQYAPIAGTSLQSVVNARTPIIVAAGRYYAVQAGVWFTAPAVTGPWTVATSVPPEIYTIPVTSPLHYVTYVRIYEATAQTVYVGYTPGYLGTVVSGDGTVVYGTGYAYTPWIGSVWYPPPATYGLAAYPVYNPAVGWSFGFAMGLATAAIAEPWWGGAYYHPGYWGYPCCGSVSANVYRNWGAGVSSGTRTWYDNAGGSFGTYASGSYANYRTGATGTYNAGRSYNPYTGVGQAGYNRSATTAAGGSNSVSRTATYNAATGQRSYASSASATGAGGSTFDRNASSTAGPQGVSRQATTSVYNAQTGQTHTWTTGTGANDHLAGADGNVYRNGDSGWQQHTASGSWQGASGSTDWADREQQARSAGDSRESAFGSGSGGWDRSGAGSSSWASRFGGAQGGSWGDRFGGGGGGFGSGDRFGGGDFGGGDRFGGGSFGSRFSSSSFADRFGGGDFRSRFGGGGFGGGRFRR